MRARQTWLFLALLLSSLIMANAEAFATTRVALVIGNSAYQNVAQLPNPANDAAAVADMFRKAGFDKVDSRKDLGSVEMRRVLRDFYDQAAGAEIAVVYYAGHGIEVDGTNYMVPVDAVLQRDRDVDDEAVSLDRILETIEQARQLRLVILDACRENPFSRTMQRTTAARAISRGLITVAPTSPNTLIAYAAKGGSTADDGNSNHSPFTTALLAHLTTPGLDVRQAFGMVRDDVMKATDSHQEPYLYGSLGGAQVALVSGSPVQQAVATPSPAASPDDPGAQMRQDYEFAERVGTKTGWTYFLQHYPDGFYSNLAKAQLDKLNAEAPPAAAPTPPPAAPNVQTAALPADTGRTTINPVDLARSVQSELKRVGCFSGNADGDWNAASRKSLDQFNKYAPATLSTKAASSDALDALRARTSRVCPLVCDHGFRADGDTCVKIACRDGYQVGDDNTCEKIPPKTATRDSGSSPSRRQQQAPQARQSAPAPSRQSSSYGGGGGGGGQIICDMHGCIPKPKGCIVVGTSTGEACQ
jgi:hypothetical protein